jgi:60 kDa SS-A/Ro ribonucleoprotein
VPSIVEALNDAFYAAFDAVVPSGKATLVGCDVSGSMSQPLSCCSALSAFDGAVALSMVTTRTEPNSMTVAFSAPTSGGRYGGMHDDAQVGLTPLTFSKSTRLDQAIASAHRIPMGGTDCSAPIRWALDNKIPAEVFHVITDNETWAGKIHPFQALREYREKTGINAKMIVVGMTSTGFTIADPSDAGMLDVVGFDAGVPSVMADFAR